ncbi:MAG: ATP-binding cassette domain-containing protein, partial [Verrucomicrobia bacterium]|nr:ATP-binding cassette domain-containing protein [Prolixibacteraceae bacterium]
MIKVEHISKFYKEVKAVDNLSFEVQKGELFGLIGPDGAGKTTLMRILMTLLIQDDGRATMAGLDVVKDYKQIR